MQRHDDVPSPVSDPRSALPAAFEQCLRLLEQHQVRKDSLLEIGCGSGGRLQAALGHGYRTVHGVEPARDLVARAPVTIRGHITCDSFRPALFRAAHFDAVCITADFDRQADPLGLLAECRRVLRPGGLLLATTNPGTSQAAQLLRLFDPDADPAEARPRTPAIDRLLAATGFVLLDVVPLEGAPGDLCLIARKPAAIARRAAA